MTVVYQKKNKTGITYAYENEPYWDKEKQQSRSKRKLIGKVDPVSGNIIPTREYKKKDKGSGANVPNSIPMTTLKRSFYGATYLLDQIGRITGVEADLKSCFPDTYKQILSLAYYLIMEDKNPLFRFKKWGFIHKHPFGEDIPSQRSSDLFASISPGAQADFFRRQGKRRIENEFWAYDTTTISSYSETLRQVQFGKNKEGDDLPQLKLLLVFGEQSGLPFYYRKLAGNIPDSKTVKHFLIELDILGFKKIKLVMDRGFYKEKNINDLYKEHFKFLIGVKVSLVFIREALDKVYDDIRSFEHYSPHHDVYAYTVTSEWRYKQERPYKGDALKENRRIYIHLYYNISKAADDERDMDKFLTSLRDELLNDKRIAGHQKQYTEYFEVKRTPVRGIQVMAKDVAIKKAKRYYGFFALISNEKMDAWTALDLYRTKDVVEKAFGNLKERLNLHRTLVSSEQSLDGKLFVEFVSLIYLSYINRRMQTQLLYKDYTLHEVLDKLDIIECFEYPGKDLVVGEVLDKQSKLYSNLGVEPPALP
ncbi:MAG: IS1634 family transposase [Treponema sp.]|jgi:transposase|nr:IS1634 family transposase [Treponema sp.]